MNRIKNLEDAVFEALTEHSPVATAAAIHRAFASFITARTQSIIEGDAPESNLSDLDATAEIGRRIGRSIAGMAPVDPQRRRTDPVYNREGPEPVDLPVKALSTETPARPGLYVVKPDGSLEAREVVGYD